MLNGVLSKKELITYALIAIPLAIVGLPLYIYLPTFYATNVELNIALVGIILFIARLTDVVSDPYIGYLSDRCLKEFGSRKPIMFLGFLILLISFYCLINPTLNYPSLWLLSFSILIYVGWSMITIPYLTWSSEISDDYYDKTKLNSFREVFTLFGLLLALIFPYLFNPSSNIQNSLNILFYTFLILFIPFFIFSMINIKVQNSSFSTKFSFEDLKQVYKKIPNLKELQIGYFLNNLANAIPATLFLLFVEVVIQDKESGTMILILYFLSGVLALPFWTLLSKKIGKKNVWISSIILASISFVFVIFLKENDVLLFAIISFISGLSLGADIAFPSSIQADVVQKVKRLQNNVSGLLFGLWTMITKLALALSVVVSFGILGLVGFDKESLTSLSIFTLVFLYGLLPIILKLIALYFIFKYKDEFIK